MALRVLGVSQAGEVGGAELALLRVAPHLAREDIELELGVPGEGGLAAAARERGLAVHALPVGPLRAGGWPRAALAWPRVRALVRRLKPDVVWLNGIVPQRVVPALGPAPALLHLHDMVETAPKPWRSAAFWRRVPVVACPSRAVARSAVKHGAPEERMRVVPEPVEAVAAAPRPDWAHGRPVVGFVGRFEPRKGVLDLLGAAERLPHARIVLVRGPDIDPDRGYIGRVEAAAAALGDRVVLTGPVPEAAGLMPWFDVLCVPSLAEPFGTVAAEALAAGTPAVVTDSGGMPEYVVHGETGAVVPPGDPAALAAALAETLAGAEGMAARARQAAERFAAGRVAGQVAGFLREAAGP